MKYLPHKFRESQCDWFAKRGIPWHITVALRRSHESDWFAKRGIPWHITVALRRSHESDPLAKETFLHVFQSCPQDSVAVSAILQDVLVTLREQCPELERTYCKQDNAGYYHCGSTIVGSRSSSHAGVKVKWCDFSDPQGGKGEAHRQAATITGHIK